MGIIILPMRIGFHFGQIFRLFTGIMWCSLLAPCGTQVRALNDSYSWINRTKGAFGLKRSAAAVSMSVQYRPPTIDNVIDTLLCSGSSNVGYSGN